MKLIHFLIFDSVLISYLLPFDFTMQDDLRQLGRVDRNEAQRKLDSGGITVVERFRELATFRMKLFKTCAEFFKNDQLTLDGPESLLLIIGRQDDQVQRE